MNRRAFLTSAGSTAAAAATVSIIPRKIYGQTPSPSSIYGTSANVAFLTSGNTITTPTTSAANWNAYRNTIIAVASDWQANSYDAQLADYYGSLTPNMCKSSNLNQAQILASVQAIYPTVTLAQLQAAWATIDATSETDVQLMITALQQNGFVQYLNAAMQQAALYSQAATAMAAASTQSGFSPASRPPPLPNPGVGACSKTAELAVATLSIALLTIAVASGVGAIGMGFAFWGAIGTFGGGGATLFGAGQVFFC